jgi:PAS domain S-box-containing protein
MNGELEFVMKWTNNMTHRLRLIRFIISALILFLILVIQAYYYFIENIPLFHLVVISCFFIIGAIGLVEYALFLLKRFYKNLENEIEKREKVSLALQQSEIMYKTLVTTLPDAVIVTDMAGAITFLSRRTLDLLGYKKESEIKYKNISDFIQAGMDKNQWIILEKIIEKKELRAEQINVLHKDGGILFIELSSSIIKNSNGKSEFYLCTLRDVSDKIKAANDKKESEEIFRTVFETAHDCIFIKDINLKYRKMNSRVGELFGARSSELLDKTDCDLFGEKIGNKIRKQDLKVLAGNIVDVEERRLINGRFKDVHVIKLPLRNASGEITGLCGIAREIADEKRTEKAIRAQKEKSQTYLDIANVIILALDRDGNITLINKKGAKILGYKKEELIGKNWIQKFVPKENRQQMEIVFSAIVAGQIEQPDYLENFIVTKSGERRLVAWHDTILKDEQGNITGTLSSGEDITDSKQIQEALEESEEMYRVLVENANEAILVTQGGMLQFANSRTATLLDCTVEKAMSTPFADFIHTDDRKMVADRHKKRIKGDFVPEVYDFRIVSKTGEIKWIELNGIKISWQNKPASLNFLSDVSDRKEAERIKNVLYNISTSVNTTNDLIELSRSIKTQVGHVIDTTNFYIALYNKQSDTISMPFFVDEKDKFTTYPAKNTLTGYVIRTGKPLLAEEPEIKRLEKIGEIKLVGTPAKIWLGVPLQSGKEIIGAVVVQSYTDPSLYTTKHMEVLQFVSGQMAMALERKKGEDQVKASLHEKEVLLKEIHHRVKNNLQIIHSLLYLQAKKTTDVKAHELFLNSQNRVRSMALIHEKLYGSKDLSKVDFSEYTKSLTDHLRSIYKTEGKTIDISVEMANIFLPIDTAIPCGLIVNELVSNSLKYAFPNGNDGKISIELSSNNIKGVDEKTLFTLIVRDNGIGLPKDLEKKQKKSLGMVLVKNLTTQLDGELERHSDNGAVVKIDFKIGN